MASLLGKNFSPVPAEIFPELLLDFIFHRVTEKGGGNIVPKDPGKAGNRKHCTLIRTSSITRLNILMQCKDMKNTFLEHEVAVR